MEKSKTLKIVGGGGRNDYIDIAKALGMLLVVWGHIKLTGISNAFVYAFHMPLFFFLSGMVFSHSRYPSFSCFVKRKFKTLLLPYVLFSVFWWIVWASFSYITHAEVESYWNPLLQTLIAQGSEGFLVHNVPLWFVPCLFVVECMYFFISKLPDIWNVLICVFCAILGYFMIYRCSFFDFKLLPWSIEVALLAIVFYCVGNLIVEKYGHKKIRDIVDGNKIISWCGLIVGFIIVYLVACKNGSITMGHSSIGPYPLLFYIGAFCGVFSMLLLCLLMEDWKWNKENHWTLKSIKWFGMNSFNAMAIHNPIKGFIVVSVAILFSCSKEMVQSSTGLSIICFLMTLIITVLLMIGLEWLKKKFAKQR